MLETTEYWSCLLKKKRCHCRLDQFWCVLAQACSLWFYSDLMRDSMWALQHFKLCCNSLRHVVVKDALTLPSSVHCWCKSMAVLLFLQTHPVQNSAIAGCGATLSIRAVLVVYTASLPELLQHSSNSRLTYQLCSQFGSS